MTRSLRWKLSAIAAATATAGVIGLAHAQITDSTPAVEAQATAEPAAEAYGAAPAMPEAATEADVSASMQTEAQAPVDATATAEPAKRSATVYSATPAVEQPSTIVVVPTVVDQQAVQNKAWAALEAEPITREDVASEAAYANKNGLIARGEMSIVGEDKGTAYVEQADQARHARSTQQHLAKLDAKHQQFFAVEQERLNQLALAEQQRQQALAAEQAAQQQQMAQQQTQPTQ